MRFIVRRVHASIRRVWPLGRASSTVACLSHPCIVMLLTPIILSFSPQACFSATALFGCDSKQVFQETDALLKQRLYSQAMVKLRQLDNCKDLAPIDRFNLGWFYGRAHDFDAAIRIFTSLSPDVPDPQTHKYAIALTQFELTDYRGTVETLTAQPGREPLASDSVNLLAVAYAKLGFYQKSYTTLREELSRNHFDRLAYLNLVTLLSDAGKLDDAAQVASEAVAVFPRDSEVLVMGGAAYALIGEFGKSDADFKAAIRISPRRAAPRFFLAASAYRQGKFATVVDEVSEAIRAGVNDSDLYYLLAESKLRLDPRNLQESMRDLDRAIELNGRSVSARAFRGKLLFEEHHLGAALADLELAHRIDPDNRSATYNLARVYFALGRKREAKALFGKLTSRPVDAVDEMGNQKLKDALHGDAK